MSKIVIRDFNFDIEPWMVNNYAVNKRLTRVLNSLSLLFPVGERFFIESIRAYKDQVSPELQEEIKLFIRQEGQHGREHRKLNKHLKVNTDRCDKEALDLLQKYGYDKEHALLVTVCLERLTGLLGIVLPPIENVILRDCEISDMWKLHALEEKEHVEVGEKVMKEVCNFGYIKQTKYMAIAVGQLVKQTVRNYRYLASSGS